ncbi:MaoC family dehydratase [Diaphorobacter sp. HDW4A]|uniref:MaoC family dehydratase n=1 Tax=Diaphorobacter sp. HDW4A TaxID=2714924 RepID=UPI0014096B77|nr:MaoC family dehydratase [Diaphorobacter sp. HDW4A]QIL79936.1 MaoC family dehydratase [Diaphorobacter sp. HDW4A]
MTATTHPSFESVTTGDELPSVTVPITVPLIAGGAIATRDYFPGHHDLEAARQLGSSHIFMNILTTNGLVQSYVEGWAGPRARLMDLKIKLGAPNYPGDSMKFTASVTAKNDDKRSVQITLKGTNSMGSHVSGTVQVAFA